MKVLYFAWLRERLDRSEDEVAPPAEVETVTDLVDWLAQRDEVLAAALEKRSIFKFAVDARIVPPQTPLAGADSVAILPPMTAG
ncbi:molybdopterin synthase sulfur carrier subunit [Devosia pacifica]|uniref:Molybdopterin synthase sulfur carrier subunit n=1 Tax=Devosia pacifica TaxID=1335967 RepID=A0A918RZM3_9HYPH|nr:molybdopterin converting factor subunit 1 [Devosia pacifica]GHA17189.1 molybdopterin synthase sulfur carrier subunit [Devosia pacifica]